MTAPTTGTVPGQRGDETPLTLRVLQMRWEAEGVVSVSLAHPAGAELPAWEPGAHIELHLPSGHIRQYSLCGDPADRHVWRIAVLREETGRGGSLHVHDTLRVGELVTVRGPRNHFALAPADAYVFVAGGIGITPLLPMIAAVQQAGHDWRLLYGGRSRSSMAFVAELERVDAGAGRVVTHPQDEAGLLPLDDWLGRPTPGTLVYSCGPAPLLDAVAARTAHWPAGSLTVERFSAAVPAPDADTGADAAFEVVAHRSGVDVTVPAGTSIVRALEEAGVYPDTSCEEGICGTCETTVLEGVPDHRDSLLSDDERASGATMMICVSRCRGSRLVLDL